MNKSLYLLLVTLTLIFSYASAQPSIEKSEVFNAEFERGWVKLLQLSNGNTLLLKYSGRDPLETTVFDKTRKLISTQKLEADYSPRHTKIVGVYELGGRPTIFLCESDHFKRILYRICLNAETGAIAKQEEIARISREGYFNRKGMLEPNDIFIASDPATDYYAVLLNAGRIASANRQLRVMQFNNMHELINDTHYTPAEEETQVVKYVSSVVKRDEVFVCTTEKPNHITQKSKVFITRFSKSKKEEIKQLNYGMTIKEINSLMRYDQASDKIFMLTDIKVGEKGFLFGKATREYSVFVAAIDPKTLNILKGQQIGGYELEVSNVFDYRADENLGMPQNFLVDNDNVTVLFEKIAMSTNGPRATTDLGDIAVVDVGLDRQKEKGYIFKKHQLRSGEMPKHYIAHRANGEWSNETHEMWEGRENMLMSYSYCATPTNRYIVYNEYMNHRKMPGRNSDYMLTVCQKIENGTTHSYNLFGNGQVDNSVCYVESSHYREDTKTYAVLAEDRNGESHANKVLWIKLD